MSPQEIEDLRRWIETSKGLATGQPFLGDRRLDAVVDVLLELAAQLWVTRRRNAALEAELVAAGAISDRAVEDHVFGTEETAAMREERAAFVGKIFRSLAALPDHPEPITPNQDGGQQVAPDKEHS